MGIGVSFFTEGVGAGPRKHMDILGLAMNDGADLRVHPSGKAVVSISCQTAGSGPRDDVRADRRRGARHPAGGRRGPPRRHRTSRRTGSAPTAAARRRSPVRAVAVVSRKVRDKARLIAATMLEARPEDLAWEKGRWYVKGDPEKGAMIEEIAARAYSGEAMPEGMEGGLDAQVIYDPPNLTYPYGAYIAVVDIDPDTAHVTVRRFIAVDDCGVRINPMIVDGQIHGGLAEGVGIALMELHHLRRGGQLPQLVVHGLPDPDRARVPRLRARRDRHAVPAPPAGRQGRRRVAERRVAAGDRERGHRRALRVARRRPHRHALYPCPGLGGDARTCRACNEWPRSDNAVSPREVTGEAAGEIRQLVPDIETLAQRLADVDYLVDEGLATSMFLSLRLPQPLLLEGEAGCRQDRGRQVAGGRARTRR